MSDDDSKYFSDDDLNNGESQAVRKMLFEWDKHSPNLIGLSGLIKSGKTLAAVFVTVAVIAGGAIWLVETGFFQ